MNLYYIETYDDSSYDYDYHVFAESAEGAETKLLAHWREEGNDDRTIYKIHGPYSDVDVLIAKQPNF